MATNPHSLSTPATSQPANKLLEAVIAESRADADRVADYLIKIGPARSPDSPMPIGRDLASFLAVILRMAHWERLGLRLHLDAGLPSATQAFAEGLRYAAEFGTIPSVHELWHAVWIVYLKHFAWHGPCELGAAIVLGDIDEDAAIEALALLLLARKRTLRGFDA